MRTTRPYLFAYFPKDTYESATTITKDRKFLFAGGYHSKGILYNLSTHESVPLYAHETTKPGYKDSYNVSHNFGVKQAKFVLNDSLLVAGGDHAKHVAWKMPNLEKFELIPEQEFTFKGAPPRTEFANDINKNSSSIFQIYLLF